MFYDVMAAQSKLFQRLIWLVDTIYSAGHISREQIDRRWATSRYNDDKDDEYGERNFHRHRETIQQMFGIDIVCNHVTKEYSIEGLNEANKSGMRSWLMNTFAINNIVNLGGGMQDRIIFEEIPEGTRYLSTIVNAMQDGRQLYVAYQGYKRVEPHSFLLAPYCLKVFKQRWYLVGKPDDHPEESEPRVYALDRMKELTPTEKPFKLPKDFKPSLFFKGQYGVDRSIREEQKIVVRVSDYDANFLRSLPLHDSQIEMKQEEGFVYFCFYVAPTYDFIMELRKFGAKLEVLEPAALRDKFREESENLKKMYE